MVHVDESCCYDEADQLGSSDDTKITNTLEFWADLFQDGLGVPTDDLYHFP